CFRRLDRLAAAITDQPTLADRKLVAFGMPAEIVVIVEDQNAGARSCCLAIEPSGREPADPAADHDQVVALLDHRIIDAEPTALAREGVGHFEGTRMLAAHAGQSRGVISQTCGGELSRRSQSGGDGKGAAVEKIAPSDGWHAKIYHRDPGFARQANTLLRQPVHRC